VFNVGQLPIAWGYAGAMGEYAGIFIWAVTQIRVCGEGYSNYRSISIKTTRPRKIWIMQAANLIVLVEDMFCVLIVIVESWTLVQL